MRKFTFLNLAIRFSYDWGSLMLCYLCEVLLDKLLKLNDSKDEGMRVQNDGTFNFVTGPFVGCS